jgi:hypothetical protein
MDENVSRAKSLLSRIGDNIKFLLTYPVASALIPIPYISGYFSFLLGRKEYEWIKTPRTKEGSYCCVA